MDIGYGGYTYPDPGFGPVLRAQRRMRFDDPRAPIPGSRSLGPSSNNLPLIHDVGPAGDLGQFPDTTQMGSHVIVRIDNYNTDLVKQAKLVGRWESDNFNLTFGGQYIDDKFHHEGANTFANGVFASFAGYGAPSGRTGG